MIFSQLPLPTQFDDLYLYLPDPACPTLPQLPIPQLRTILHQIHERERHQSKSLQQRPSKSQHSPKRLNLFLQTTTSFSQIKPASCRQQGSLTPCPVSSWTLAIRFTLLHFMLSDSWLWNTDSLAGYLPFSSMLLTSCFFLVVVIDE